MTAPVTEKQMNILRGTFHLKNCLLLSFELLYVHLISNTGFRDSSALITLTIQSNILGTLIQWAEIVITSSVPVRSRGSQWRVWVGKHLEMEDSQL